MTNGDPDRAKTAAELDARVEQIKAFLASHRGGYSPTPSPSSGQPDSFWNIFALLSPILGIVVAELVSQNSSGFGNLGVIVFAPLASSLLGIIAASVAIFRRERRPAITALAFAINSIPIALFLRVFLTR